MHDYPLIRAGGLFLLIVGTGILAGAAWMPKRRVLLAVSLALAALLTALFAAPLARPLGDPTTTQIAALAGAVAMEVLLIIIVARRVLHRDEERGELAILLIVGLHFLPMALTFGPLIALLGVLSAFNASSGLWWSRATPFRAFWAIDGMLKAVLGGVMLFSTR